MISVENNDYHLFFKFIETYSPIGFRGIDPLDPLMVQLEASTEKNSQFFYIADIIQLQVLFTSKLSKILLGVEPKDINPHFFMQATHQDDLTRLNLGRSIVISKAQDLFIKKKGYQVISTNFKIKRENGSYSDFLIQGYLFYTSLPYETVYFLKIHTLIDWYKKIKKGYHYYIGENLSYLKYPDKKFLDMGIVFTHSEFNIIKLIAAGLSSSQIAEKLFISKNTVNTHRVNILRKTQKAHIFDVILDLKEQGML